MMGIRWGNGIPSALRGTTAVYANGYAVRCVKPAVFPRRCSITLRHLPSDFSISTTDLFEAAYILGHHQIATAFIFSVAKTASVPCIGKIYAPPAPNPFPVAKAAALITSPSMTALTMNIGFISGCRRPNSAAKK